MNLKKKKKLRQKSGTRNTVDDEVMEKCFKLNGK